MSVSANYREFVIEQLARVAPPIRAKSMFGGVGIYSNELFFALIDDDELYLKVDDSNRPDFVKRKSHPFQPGGPGGETMQYYLLPAEILEDVDELKVWVEKAVSVAGRKRKKKRKA